MLPSEYGGKGGSLAEITDYWVKEAVNQKDWFARFLFKFSFNPHDFHSFEEGCQSERLYNPHLISFRAELYKTEEEKRPGGKKTHSDLFGIEGSFRFFFSKLTFQEKSEYFLILLIPESLTLTEMSATQLIDWKQCL